MGELEFGEFIVEWDDNIDFSDIPRMTKEELAKFKPARLRQRKSQNVAS